MLFGLEKSRKESIDIGMENLGESDQFGNFDVHTVGFQLGIGTFGHGNPHQVQLCNDLFLGEFILITDGLDILTDIHIWSDFLHHKVLS